MTVGLDLLLVNIGIVGGYPTKDCHAKVTIHRIAAIEPILGIEPYPLCYHTRRAVAEKALGMYHEVFVDTPHELWYEVIVGAGGSLLIHHPVAESEPYRACGHVAGGLCLYKELLGTCMTGGYYECCSQHPLIAPHDRYGWGMMHRQGNKCHARQTRNTS